MSERVTVSIIIPCYQEETFITDCVQSCLQQETEALVDIIVVDGGSTDESIALVKKIQDQHPNKIELLHNAQKITPISLNLGLQHSQADFKMILGAHAILPNDFVAKCLNAFAKQPKADCVGGIIENRYLNPTAEDIGFAMSSSFGVGNAIFRTGGKAQWVDTVAFGMYKKSVFEKIGWFNESLIRNQDDEFNYRLNKAELKIWFDPDISSVYFVRSSYEKLWKQYFQYGFWKVYVNKLHSQITTVRQLVPAALVMYCMLLPLASMLPDTLFIVALLPFIFYMIIAFTLPIRHRKIRFFKTSIVFLILHFSYGLGYWKGIIQLLLLNKQPSNAHAKHNR
jgi:glycosyltransferase involved in cell wall biosynthesis